MNYAPDISHHVQEILRLDRNDEDFETKIQNYDIRFLIMFSEVATGESTTGYNDYYQNLLYNSYYNSMMYDPYGYGYGYGYGGYGGYGYGHLGYGGYGGYGYGYGGNKTHKRFGKIYGKIYGKLTKEQDDAYRSYYYYHHEEDDEETQANESTNTNKA